MRSLRKILAAAAGFGSLFSGLFWHVAAKAQLEAIQMMGDPAATAARGAADLEKLSAHANLWAAYGAGGAGIALALALFLDEWPSK